LTEKKQQKPKQREGKFHSIREGKVCFDIHKGRGGGLKRGGEDLAPIPKVEEETNSVKKKRPSGFRHEKKGGFQLWRGKKSLPGMGKKVAGSEITTLIFPVSPEDKEEGRGSKKEHAGPQIFLSGSLH